MFELDARKLLQNKKAYLRDLLHETDSRYIETKCQAQLDLLDEFAEPIIWKLICDLEETTKQLHSLIKEKSVMD